MNAKIARNYLSSGEWPWRVALGIFALSFLNLGTFENPLATATLFVLLLLSLVAIPVSAVVQLTKGRIRGGVVNLLALPLILSIVFLGSSFIFREKVGQWPDDVRGNLAILAGVDMELPVEFFDEPDAKVTDLFTRPPVATPEMRLAKGLREGVFVGRALVNPGEPGRAYLEVVPATRHKSIPVRRLKPTELVNLDWSTNSAQKFSYQYEITVSDSGTYPARFELWFLPDAGTGARKLVERGFRIKG